MHYLQVKYKIVDLSMDKKNTILFTIGILLIILISQLSFLNAFAQNEVMFYSTDKFEITELNSEFSFSSEGSYEMDSLDDGVWKFVNFQLNDGFKLETFSVSAIDSTLSNLTMQSFGDDLGLILSYTVMGEGEQSFNFGDGTVGGSWSVIFDDVFVAENSGWHILPDNTLSITGIASTVTLLYIVTEGTADSSDKSFFEQHSVSILMTIIVITVLVIAIVLRFGIKKTSTANPE